MVTLKTYFNPSVAISWQAITEPASRVTKESVRASTKNPFPPITPPLIRPIRPILMPLSSPVPYNSGDEWDTPVRKRVRTLRYDSAQSFGSIENVTGVLKQTVQRICAATSSRRITNNPKYEEQQGKAAKIGPKDIRRMEQILEEDGFCARALTWEQLGYKADLDVCGAIIRRHIATLNYHKCLACRKG